MSYWSTCCYRQSHQLCLDALRIYREIGDLRGAAKALNNKGHVENSLARHRDARESYRQALAFYRESSRRDRHAVLDHNEGDYHLHMGDCGAALRYYRHALHEYRRSGARANESDVLNGIGAAYLELGRPAKALEHFEQAKAIAGELGCVSQEVRAMIGIARVRLTDGDVKAAGRIYRDALAQARAIRDRRREAEIYEGLGAMIARRDRAELARIYWRQAYNLYDEMGLAEPRERMAVQLATCGGFDWDGGSG
jgi:tetratricopeptide (TPR) repeat protein